MPSSESWSREDPDYPGQSRRELVLAKIQNALDWWNAQSPDGSLELFMPAAGSFGAPQTVKVGYEPIRMDVKYGWKGHPVLSDAAWRWQAMSKLGFGPGARRTSRIRRHFRRRIRSRNDADWAFVVYVVDSLNDKDGMFRNQVVAYTADLFGPYSMLTYDNDGYHFNNFDAVLAHEMGHVFGALDEYAPPAPGYPSTGDSVGLSRGAQPQRGERGNHGPAVHHARLQRDSERVRQRRALPLDDRTDRAAGQRCGFATRRGGHTAGLHDSA